VGHFYVTTTPSGGSVFGYHNQLRDVNGPTPPFGRRAIFDPAPRHVPAPGRPFSLSLRSLISTPMATCHSSPGYASASTVACQPARPPSSRRYTAGAGGGLGAHCRSRSLSPRPLPPAHYTMVARPVTPPAYGEAQGARRARAAVSFSCAVEAG